MSLPGKGNLIRDLTQWVIAQEGHCYTWGGEPGPNLTGCWDCSSFCNYAWGHVGRQSIPGFAHGSYDGTEHGPSTLSWLAWQGQGVGAIDRSLCEAGDLAVWRTHMGFCVSNTEMVSAQNPANGTRLSGIDGFIEGEQLTILRMAVVGGGGIDFPPITFGGTGQLGVIVKQIAQMTQETAAISERLRTTAVPPGKARP